MEPERLGKFINNFHYKQFDLIVELQYMYGNDVLNQTHHSGEDRIGIANSFSTVLDAYDPAKGNDNTMIAAIRDTTCRICNQCRQPLDGRWIIYSW